MTSTSSSSNSLPQETKDAISRIPLFERKELQVGRLLGCGRFSQVHEVTNSAELQLLKRPRPDATTNTTESSTSPSSQEQQRHYVMKHLQHRMFQHRHHHKNARDLRNALADLLQEAIYLSQLDHPHIIKLRGFTKGGTAVLQARGAREDHYFLLIDKMQETLDQRIRSWRQKKSCTEVVFMAKLDYALQIADALRYLHSKCIIFRDLKPENIGFLEQDFCQLFDFGLARTIPKSCLDDPDKLFTLSQSGTRRYMAVEVFNNKGRYNCKADCYSWAMVFWEILSMCKPFADFTVQDHQELVCRLGGRPRFDLIHWPTDTNTSDDILDFTLPDSVKDLLRYAWTPDPKERASMAQIHHRLEQMIEEHKQVREHRPSRTTPWPPYPSFNKFTSGSTVATDPMASDSEQEEDSSAVALSASGSPSACSSFHTTIEEAASTKEEQEDVCCSCSCRLNEKTIDEVAPTKHEDVCGSCSCPLNKKQVNTKIKRRLPLAA